MQELLSIARKTEASFQQININAMLEDLKSLLSETFPKIIDIALDLDPEIPSLVSDSNQIHQVLLNVCVNARDSMPDGGKLLLGNFYVAGAELRQRFDEAQNDLYVRIGVADTGTGIDDDTKNRIFKPFFTTKALGQGTGLGLSVAYGIMRNHSGFIDVKNEPGQRTSFSIYLPIAKDKPEIFREEQKLDGTRQRAAGSGAMVLFVDDEEYQVRLMRKLWRMRGIESWLRETAPRLWSCTVDTKKRSPSRCWISDYPSLKAESASEDETNRSKVNLNPTLFSMSFGR